jgi:hypothetical protein
MAAAADALGGYLWDAVRTPRLDPFFKYSVEGPFDLLRDQAVHWNSHGIDPFEKWDGDRPKERA